MNATERRALQKIIENNQHPCVPGNVYETGEDGKLHRTDEPPLVKGVENHKLLESDEYKAGWLFCHSQYEQLIQFFLQATIKDLRRFAGKATKQTKRPLRDHQSNA